MKFYVYLKTYLFLSSFLLAVTRCGYTRGQDGEPIYHQGVDSFNFLETKFTETLYFEYFDAIVNGIDVKRNNYNGV